MSGLHPFTVKPNPVEEGGAVTVKGKPGDEVQVISGGTRKTVKLGQNGTATFKEPVGSGKTFTVSDVNPGPNGAFEIDVSVIGSRK